jgi:glycosyltransferase involved in cell wall biosynthesis
MNQADSLVVPQVSIGMPVFNGEPFIREALDSLLAQTFKDFELIISDNASTDGTRAICHEYAERDARIRYVRQIENRGPSENFRFVLDEALGYYFMWAAADDLQSDSFVESLTGVLDGNPQLVCAMSDVLNVYEDHTTENFIAHINDIRVDAVNKCWAQCRKRFFRNPTSNIFFCVYGLFRTSYLKQVDLTWRGVQKYLFSIEIPIMAQVALLGPIASIPYPLKTYRRSSHSLYHSEQKLLTQSDRIAGFVSVSRILIDIVLTSRLGLLEKLDLLTTICATTGRWLPKLILPFFYERCVQALLLMHKSK